ncbi:MAG: type II toxin-antitoxin system VapC family toxin [Acidobacteria bacterium]|nr:type II toxin-antitoxin system VapC family toxin [Acidobacteriota bacterium]
MAERCSPGGVVRGGAKEDRSVLERLQKSFEGAGQLVAPDLADWVQSGLVLSRLGARYGYEQIGRGRLTNDALIAMSAARLGLCILTANSRDFARLAQFRDFQWETLSRAG